MVDDELDLDVTDVASNVDKGSGSSSSSGGGSGGGGSRRTNVFVKGVWGTTVYDRETTCGKCGERAIGVLVIDVREGGRMGEEGTPLCGKHRDQMKEGNKATWEEGEFRRFVD